MTIRISTEHAEACTMTRDEMNARIEQLVIESGMTRAELTRRGEAFELDAQQRGRLAEIEGLEWLSRLDGTDTTAVSLTTGLATDELDDLGGMPEDAI